MVNTDGKKSLTIKNDFIGREFKIEHKRLSTVSISNYRTGRAIIPGDNSEEFSVCFAGFPKRVIDCGELRVDEIKAYENEGVSTAVFTFKSIKIKGCQAVIKLFVTLNDSDFFMNKYLTVECEDAPEIKLDSVCLDIITVDPLIKTVSVPAQEGAQISGFHMALGQPVYVDSVFMGCEFPVCINSVKDGCVQLKYYSGKDFSVLLQNGIYTSYSAVYGSASGTDESTVTADFFRYIDKISLPGGFRRQYNSWYDNMLDINNDNLSHSFFEVEKGCTAYGVKPLDAYVADDGWNNYNADFWSFNEKCPDGMYPAVKTAKLLGSSFGLWLGPRGGYNTKTAAFAKRIEEAGNGHFNRKTRDICVASKTYVENVSKLLSDYVEKYDISYLKLDGFAKKPCKSDSHGHLTGGKDNMYFYTVLCEKWLELFSSLRKQRAEKGKDIWLNATCYVNPSPWLLKWVNSVWIQNSFDCGMTDTADDGTKLSGSDKDKLLTYRDGRYYDFYRVRSLRFPPRCLYNHEPVYGKTANISMTDDEFLQYLLMNACRGTAFWELYYSYEMMSDRKWAYSAAVLDWAEKHSRVLSRSQMIGNSPTGGLVYGYACFDGADGVIALRNPSQKEASYTLRFDEKLCIDKSVSAVCCTDALTGAHYGDISYASNMEIKLRPHEMKVFAFGSVEPLEIPPTPDEPVILRDEEAISGVCAFTVRAFVSPDTDGVIYAQGNDIILDVTADGKISFTVGNDKAVSVSSKDECAQAAAVREPNGMIKLYIDGVLQACAYSGVSHCITDTQNITRNGKLTVFKGALPFDKILSI
ncbi:MAG: hypothetical protein MJ177_09615 [Clostridia bacterium]|nr:hypothetical protein [Clostridia bacterium]